MKQIAFILVSIVSCPHGIGLGITGQKPFDASGNWPVISIGITTNSKWPPVYFSSGAVLRPGPAMGTTYAIPSIDEKRKTHSFYGFYGGTHVGIAPAFRPGVLVGLEWKKDEVMGSDDGRLFRKAYTKYEIGPYFGLEVHVFILSFIVSNEGFGVGMNLTIGKETV